MTSFLPFCPSFRRALGFLAARAPGYRFDIPFASSHTVRRHLTASCPSASYPPHVVRRPKAMEEGLSRKLLCPSAFIGSRGAFIHRHGCGDVRGDCFFSPEVPLSGLATRLARSTSPPSEASFSSRHSWAFPFRAFLLFGCRRILSKPPAVLTLLFKTSSASNRRLNGL